MSYADFILDWKNNRQTNHKISQYVCDVLFLCISTEMKFCQDFYNNQMYRSCRWLSV